MLKYHRIVRGILQGKVQRLPYRLNISLTNVCDSRCKTCDVWEIYPKKRFNLREELTGDEFRNIFRRLPKSLMWISFSGGEPHLRKDFTEIMAAAFSEVRNIAMINIPNNGIKADRCVEDWKEVLAIRKRPYVFISMSIDGPAEVHDEVRGVAGNYESATRALEEIQGICRREGNAAIGIGLTISKFNYDRIMPFVRQVLDRNIPLKIEAASTGDLFYQGRDSGERPDLAHAGIREVVREIYGMQKRKQWRWYSPIDFLTRNHVRGAMRFLENPSRLVIPCSAARSNYGIDCYGNVNPCFFYTSRFGNLRDYEYDLMALLRDNSEKVAKARSEIKQHHCTRCWHICNSIDSMIDRKLTRPWTFLDV